MDVLALVRASFRHWLVVIPLMVIAVGGALLNYQFAAPSYVLKTQLIVLSSGALVSSSDAPASSVAVNPYGSQITAAAQAAALGSTTPSALALVARRGPSASFTVAVEQQLPIIDVTASSAHPATLGPALRNFIEVARSQFERLQVGAGAPPQQFLQLLPLTDDAGAPQPVYNHRGRTLLLLAGAGVLVALLVGLGLDRRRPLPKLPTAVQDSGVQQARARLPA